MIPFLTSYNHREKGAEKLSIQAHPERERGYSVCRNPFIWLFVEMTLRYSHFAPAHKTAALAVLDGAFNGQPNCTFTAQSKEKGLRLSP